MSYDTDRYGLEKRSNQSLGVVECGIQICHSGHTSPRLNYKYYSAHFILEGKGTYILGDKSYELGPGQGFMITPGASCIYAADRQHPWKYVYVSFCGIDDDALVHSAGLDEEYPIFSFPLDEEMVRDLLAMHAAGKMNEADGYDVTGYFLLCMSRLVKANMKSSQRGDMTEIYVKKACAYIEDHYADEISIKDICFHVGVDRSYLYRLFQKHLGDSPSVYLRQYRLEKAAQMLEGNELTIAQIGDAVGFYDVSHFYKAFKEHYGISPKMYRAQFEDKE